MNFECNPGGSAETLYSHTRTCNCEVVPSMAFSVSCLWFQLQLLQPPSKLPSQTGKTHVLPVYQMMCSLLKMLPVKSALDPVISVLDPVVSALVLVVSALVLVLSVLDLVMSVLDPVPLLRVRGHRDHHLGVGVATAHF